MELSKRDLGDLARAVGAVLFAVGAAAWLLRLSTDDTASDLERFLILLFPALILFEQALRDEPPPHEHRARPATSVLAIAAILLGSGAMFAFTNLVGAEGSIYGVAVFALSALLAAYTARRLRVAYAALLAGLAAFTVWELLWGIIIPHQSASTVRWLLILAAVLLFAAAAGLARARAIGSRELATVGGLVAVAAGVLGVIQAAVQELFGGLLTVTSEDHGTSSTSLSHHTPSLHSFQGSQSVGWDLYLLVVSALLVWLAARVRARGLGYVGAIGLLAFTVDVSLRVTEGSTTEVTSSALAGWPLALLLLGLIGIALPRVFQRE